jgi:hypothetical protein
VKAPNRNVDRVTTGHESLQKCTPYMLSLVQRVGTLVSDLRSVVSQLRPPMNIFLHLRDVVSICTGIFSNGEICNKADEKAESLRVWHSSMA